MTLWRCISLGSVILGEHSPLCIRFLFVFRLTFILSLDDCVTII